MILGLDESSTMADIPRSYHIPSTTSTSPNSSPTHNLLTTPTNVNPPMSPFVSSMFPWHYPPAASFVGAMQKPQFTYNNNIQPHSGSSSGFQSFQSEANRAESSLSSISSRSTSPHSQLDVQGTSGYHTLNDKKPELYDSKRLAGYRAMQSRPNPGVYRVPTNTWSGYGISHTSPGAMMKREEDIWKTPEAAAGGTQQVNNNFYYMNSGLINYIDLNFF